MKGLIAVLVVSTAAMTALAQAEEPSLEHGRQLAEINCTKCHALDQTSESPLTDAPPFREVALNYTVEELTDGFLEGLAVRHPLMPDWEMTEKQAEDLTAFIMSLRPK
jgi:mono/diheme cytochrome c family protein